MIRKIRKPNVFENMVLIIGSFVMIAGYLMIHKVAINTGMTGSLLQTIFVWLSLLMIIILVAVSENMKEELRLLNTHQLLEIRLLKDETSLVRKEVSLLREEIKKQSPSPKDKKRR